MRTDHHHRFSDPCLYPISSLNPERSRRSKLSTALDRTLDRVNVLGDDTNHGHTGCVNALSWARDGDLLLSGGDDTTVRIWAIDAADNSQEYPYVCRAVIQTGHQANIFSTQMLPYSSRIATVAGDNQVRVFDIGEDALASSNGRETSYSARQSCIGVLQCHRDRVKRIVTEYSPDLFLSVGEDGSVRQHDLRTPHECSRGSCPPPLVKVNHELSTLALSPLTPYQFVVAGESPYGYLFDRRHAGRFLREEWGMVPGPGEEDSVTTCVRRFGRPKKTPGTQRTRSEHVTGARVSTYNGHEILLSYSGDAVYLYSTADDPEPEGSMSSTPSLLASNAKQSKVDAAEPPATDGMDVDDTLSTATEMGSNLSTTEQGADDGHDTHTEEHNDGDGDDDDEGYLEFADFSEGDEENFQPHVPIVLPRRRFAGARNVATIKDVNFLGPVDDFVASGSDDGNFFVWRKSTGALHGIYEGDSSVVNMVEGHPHLPLVAVSGIDTTVKLFAPCNGPSRFSKIANAERIIEINSRLSRTRTIRYNFAALLAEARVAMGAGGEAEIPECRSQ
ncbi:WD repeat protein iqw1 [Hypsizygus marmoreus]|uniref:WD repeat protein iqw1 n=1 Tax=Hypsizygus marmoreus TaxID=39966 RepID=A0A369JQR9_HYPMA|nr:WD repeat protein iqw1 [Hypsizygus marmoreus]